MTDEEETRLNAALAVAVLGLKLIADKAALDPDKTAAYVLKHLDEEYGVHP